MIKIKSNRGVFFLLLFITALHTRALTSPLETPKLLILGIDGCRPDALLLAQAPIMRELVESGTYSWYALSRPPTKSGPCWSSIMTGVWNDKHGVTDNTFANKNSYQYPHFFKRLKDFNPALNTASLVYWGGINSGVTTNADYVRSIGNDDDLAAEAINLLNNDKYDCIFVQFGEIDAAGHSDNFSPNSPQYIAAIEKIDGLVGNLLAALHSRPTYQNENWLILTLADHGGNGSHHGGTMLEEMRIFIGVSGDRVAQQETGNLFVLDTLQVPAYGVKLNGASDYIAIADSSLYQFGAEQDFTIEMNIKSSGWSGHPVIIGNKNAESMNNPGFAILQWDNGTWLVNIADGEHNRQISGPLIYDNQWHHIAAVFDRDSMLTLYQDGIKSGGIDIATIGDISSNLGLCIGQDGTWQYDDFADMSISECRIWNAALPDSVLRRWMLSPVTAAHPDYAALLGYWKMDAEQDTIVTDYSANHVHGVLHGGMPEWLTVDAHVELLDFENTPAPKTVDVAVTALAHFGVSIDSTWKLDGQVLARANKPLNVEQNTETPAQFSLHQNFPNPFNPVTTIQYEIPVSSLVTLTVYDRTGREAAVLVRQNKQPGRHTIEFDGSKLASGIYFYRLTAGGNIVIHKCIIIR